MEEKSECAGNSPRLICSSCRRSFVNPRMLPCLHTFCSTCISGFRTYPMNRSDPSDSKDDAANERGETAGLDQPSFDSADDKADDKILPSKRMILCPDCLREVEVAADVSTLPMNYVIERLLTEESAKKINNNLSLVICDSCADQTEGAEVTVRCTACSENLCSYCEQAHRRQRKTRNHELVSVNEDIDVDESKRYVHRKIYCQKHPVEDLKLFCSDCDEVVCKDCVVLEHRSHDCQLICPELFRSEMDALQNLIHNVVPKVTAVESRIKTIAILKDKIRNRAKQVESEINTFMDSYIQAIEKHRQSLVGQIYATVQEKERTLNVAELHLKDSKGEVIETCKLVSELVDSGSDLEVLTVKKLITGRLNRLNSINVDSKANKINEFLKFNPEEKADVINDFQMFGKIVSSQLSSTCSTVEGDGLSTARIGHTSEMTLIVKDTEQRRYSTSSVGVRAWLIYQKEPSKNIPVSINSKKDGTHKLTFTPLQKGTHFLHVVVNGRSVKDSPRKFSVKGKWRDHTGVWQCCTFCHTGGRRDVSCGCKAIMPGGFAGCGHGHDSHPGGFHWSCCGKMVENSECPATAKPAALRQFTL